MNNDIRELSFEELKQVSGGDVLNMAIDAYEKQLAAVGANLMAAIHQPTTPKITLH
jgi:bacteriocin-like protein